MRRQLLLWAAFVGLLSLPQGFSMAKLPPAVDEDGGKLWAVLAAGSQEWYNYRHQADVCHAYQILKKHGVPEERIVVMMEDDIAYNFKNPDQGKIINQPDGPNVYTGVPKDYIAELVTPTNFLDVIQGANMDVGSKKTIDSTTNDNIFIYFSDHGAEGLVQFGDTILKAVDFINAIKQAKFKNMLIYWESCESGSMFQGLLPNNTRVFATSASSPIESSYACYEDKRLQTYLGDVYSVSWMEDADSEVLSKESLEKQFEIVREETNKSQVMEWGDMSLKDMKLSQFLGKKEVIPEPHKTHDKYTHAVKQEEVPVAILTRALESTNDIEESIAIAEELQDLHDKRDELRKVMDNILETTALMGKRTLVRSKSVEDLYVNCYYPVVDAFDEKCYRLGCNDYALSQVGRFADMCRFGFSANDMIQAIGSHCNSEDGPICGVY